MQARCEACSSTPWSYCNQFLLNSESFKQKIQIQDSIAGFDSMFAFILEVKTVVFANQKVSESMILFMIFGI